MRCPNCNNEIADNSASCIFCVAKSSAIGHDEDIEDSVLSTDQPRLRPAGISKSGIIILSFTAGVLLAGLGLWGYWLMGIRASKESNTQPIGIVVPISSAKGGVEKSSSLHQPNPDPKQASKEDVSANNGTTTLPNIELPVPEPFIHPSRMDVLYRGVSNPISVRVPGHEHNVLSLSVTNGTLGKDAKGWSVRPGTGPTTSIQVNLIKPDGSSSRIGSVSLRVKNVPNPHPYFADKSLSDETIPRDELITATGVSARMVDFDFDLSFEIVEFKVTMIVGGTPIEKMTKGPAVSGDMKEMFRKAKPGQKIYIEGIKVKGPDGSVRSLGALSLKVI